MKKLQTVLVIDDSKLARVFLARLLKAYDLEVLDAESVDEGIAVLNANTVNAVFMDAMMPDIDGFEGITMIKNDPALQHIPCAMYSGELSDEAKDKARIIGADAYLCKPATNEAVAEVLTIFEAVC